MKNMRVSLEMIDFKKFRTSLFTLASMTSDFLMQVEAEALYTEMDHVEKGILELITKHGISNLVMGAAADKHYSKYKPQKDFSFFHF